MDADHDGSSGRGDSGSVHEDVRPQAVSHEPAGPDAPAPEAEAPAPPAPTVPDTPGVGVGIAGLSFSYQVVAALALSLIGLLACAQVAMVFLHVAPSNTLTKQHGKTVDDWIYPEFEQNWKLFAPNPLQQNIAVHVRAEVAGADGRRTTDWISLTDADADGIRGNLFPSHVHQNELRRGWDFYVNSHDDRNKPNGLRGDLSERYIRRIAMLRLDGVDLGGTVERIQMRSASSLITPPSWSTEKADTRPTYRELPWWPVNPDDLPAPRDAARAEKGDK
ncbi:DUF5819 family protein [Streptomyces cyaneofuscatus]|uniref:DUF5819 family protein n=1 Tax=Streptomyces cyaneofuscatus TaxID=66883 RepID=A0ABZ1F885_9ACTN|nr:DUF5819 family protein [Streptomyces cyaneofuscatus]WSB12381.1 DUF5819 family protein [Streptomyces cyaneofuscatus]WSD50929.1 DUF5819 family protein [Streptomyces cyaneofuscatus]WTA94436.1 DUF5819 family protein [Streptomyces cyaneofuscatus]